ncbi:MAG: sulfotransferase domain-containing protein [Solirubrobacterales bacterium]|nr:sulfotransferase domain-containing protein [Solirubrobacterales bacterium]
MKSGTSSLHHYLGEHPEIQKLPAMKETNFFSGPPNGIPYPPGSKRIERLEDYEKLFDSAYEVRGEISPCYAIHPRRQGVPERISQLIPDAKLIYLVRDPIDRAVSHYHFSVAVEDERRPLSEALTDFSDPYSLYTSPGLYVTQLELYRKHFRDEQILVIDQADLLANRQEALSEIFAFLSVDRTFVSPRFEEEVNTGDELNTYSYFVVLHRRVQGSLLLQRLLLQRMSPGLRRSIRQAIQRLFSKPLAAPELDPDTRARLQEYFAEEVRRLRVLTGKAFPTWSV